MGESRGGGGGPEHTKLRLHGLFTQVRNGPAEQEDQGQTKKVDGSSKEDETATFSPLTASGDSSVSSPPRPSPGDGSSSSNSNSSISTGSPRAAGTTINRSRSTEQGQNQLEAWRECRAMSKEEAMKAFLLLLFSLAPYWKYEQFL